MNRRTGGRNRNRGFLSIKTGRVPSLKQGVIEMVLGTLIGFVWISLADHGSPEVGIMNYFGYAGYFVIVISIAGGGYHIYNAFAINRFSEEDVVFSDQEQDPLSGILKRDEHTPSNGKVYCTSCGKPVDQTFKFCSGCGKKLTNA